MEASIQAVALVISLLIMILVAKWQVDDDIKKMQKRLDDIIQRLEKLQNNQRE